MMTCSRDGVADCGMAGRVQNAARSHLGGVPSCRYTQSEERSCICQQQQADEGRSEPLAGCTDGGARTHRGAAMYKLCSAMYHTREDTCSSPYFMHDLYVSSR